jgi:hypothetical protein
MKKIFSLVIAVAALAAVVIPVSRFVAPSEVYAQSGSDTAAGKNEKILTASTSVNTTTQLFAAQKMGSQSGAASAKIVVKSILVNASVATILTFQDGSGGTTLYNMYCPANTPQQIPEHLLGQGFATSVGNGLYAVSSAGASTVTISCRARLDPY